MLVNKCNKDDFTFKKGSYIIFNLHIYEYEIISGYYVQQSDKYYLIFYVKVKKVLIQPGFFLIFLLRYQKISSKMRCFNRITP